MSLAPRAARLACFALVLACLGHARPAAAHLMVSQHGTLHVVGDGAFLVLALPAAAFPDVDDDHDGRLARAEARAHQDALLAAIAHAVTLTDGGRPCRLDGLMVQLSPPDGAPTAPAPELVALGRFQLADGADLRLRVDAFAPAAPATYVTITRGDDQQLVTLTPDAPEAALLRAGRTPFRDAVRAGVGHILGGLDHLLFLLVVLAGGVGWRRVLATLSCFTLGHAVTLALGVFAGVRAPAAVVEPAIALTIVAMAALDVALDARGRPLARRAHLGLVFACALVHGLAFATALADLGLVGGDRVAVVVGFNVGIELGQLAACVVAVAAVRALPRVARGLAPLARLAAIAVGLVWFLQRTLP